MNFDCPHYLNDVYSADTKCILSSEMVNFALLLSENQDEMGNLLSDYACRLWNIWAMFF